MTNLSLRTLEDWARAVKRDVIALWIAARDPRTPWYARTLAAVVAAYALSPIDLIPDIIPILGLVDDVVLVPLGIVLAMRLIPPALMRDYRVRASQVADRPVSRTAAVFVVVLWVGSAAGIGLWWVQGR